jgi:cell surface hyaluronidase
VGLLFLIYTHREYLCSRSVSALVLGTAFFSYSPITLAAIPTKTWSGNYPTTGSVTIPAGQSVLLDTNLNLKNLTINGSVMCANKSLNLQSGWILVQGKLECGTNLKPYTGLLKITLTGKTENIQYFGTKFIGVINGGSIEFNGKPRSFSWTHLAASVKKGETLLKVQGQQGLKYGDKIVIASTDFHSSHAEEATISASSRGVIMLTKPLRYNHWCKKEVFSASKSIEECAEIGVLNRNIFIQGDADSERTGFGGHIMIMQGGSAKLANVELFRMGQKGLVGHYPMHWHFVGNAPGQYLKDSSIHNAYNRFVSIHNTHHIELINNVGYKTRGHGFYLEDGIETHNLIAGNLGLSVQNASDSKPTISDKFASVFWISNPNNTIRNNVAAGSEHTGFWLGFPEHPVRESKTASIWPRRTPLLEFSDNVSHSNASRGLFVDGGEFTDSNNITNIDFNTWYEPRKNPADDQSPLVRPVFRNFTAYKNRDEGVWIRSFASPVLTGAKLADNWMGAYFASINLPSDNNIGSIDNVLIVGETSNKGNPEIREPKGLGDRELPHLGTPDAPIRGIEFYDGPMAVGNSLFANFQPNTQREAGALTNVARNFYWVSSQNYSEKLTFVNANRVYLPLIEGNANGKNSGDVFSTFLDKDGSVTGTAGMKIVPNNPLLLTAQCTFKAAWNAYLCPHEYVNLRLYLPSGPVPLNATFRRDDGVSLKIANEPNNGENKINANLIVGRTYSLQLPFTTPKQLKFDLSEKIGKPLRLSIAYPFTNFKVTFLGLPVEKATSLAQLATGGQKYFHDGKNLHLRLISQNKRYQEVLVTP